MKLTYIYHSCFLVEGRDFSVLIDYYRDTPDAYVHRHVLASPGRLYLLASHAHPDHFNPEVLDWRMERPDIRFIFSEDIREARLACYHDAVFLKKGETWSDDRLRVEAFGSTDAGVSFLLNIDDKRIFHAGDLNNWHWKEESTPEEAAEAEAGYLRELDSLARATDYVDLALFPLDPRLGKEYDRGARQFIDRIRTRQFAPMHFWDNYSRANAFRPCVETLGGRFIAVSHQGQHAALEE